VDYGRGMRNSHCSRTTVIQNVTPKAVLLFYQWSNYLFLLVGAAGFEPATLCSQSRCATGLRYAPTDEGRDTRSGSSQQPSPCPSQFDRKIG
jgi:hypothetical protein